MNLSSNVFCRAGEEKDERSCSKIDVIEEFKVDAHFAKYI